MTEPYVTLYYLKTAHNYTVDHYLNGIWQPDWYAQIFSCPVREMLSKNETELAEELLRMVNAQDWVSQYKRAMRRGDYFTIGTNSWLYIPTKDLAAYTAARYTTHILNSWPETGIVAMPRTLYVTSKPIS